MMRTSMRLKWQKSRRNPALRLLRCTAGRGSSIIPERRIGDIIAQVKQAVKIPVIGNGDVVDAASALRLFEQTGCDGIMVGRGAQGNPWIFREILAALEDREIPARPNRRELYEMIVRHVQLSCTYKGEYITVREMRKHLAWYTTGLPHAAALRRQINSMETMEELMEGMKLLLEA